MSVLTTQSVNPYGRSKLIIEDMFRDLFAAENDWQIILLRYFNPVGAHASGADSPLMYGRYSAAGDILQSACYSGAARGDGSQQRLCWSIEWLPSPK